MTRTVERAGLRKKVDPRHTALVVVDMQNDFCARGGAYDRIGLDVSMMQAIVPRVRRIVEAARARRVPVIWVLGKSGGLPPSTVMADIGRRRFLAPSALFGLRGRRGPGQYVRGLSPWGERMAAGLAPRDGETVVVKAGYGAFEGTPLDHSLRRLGVRTVVLVGVVTNVCVESTARAACDRGYHVVVLEDGTGTVTPALHRISLEVMGTYFGQVVRSDLLLQAWGRTPARTSRKGGRR